MTPRLCQAWEETTLEGLEAIAEPVILAYGLAREREGMERAAKALCAGCAENVPLKDLGWLVHIAIEGGESYPSDCQASAIRALMDAGEEEKG